MGYHCDFCGERRSMVYCRSDDACLCLSCDRNVHSANALSRRHSRTLLCEKCNSHPAVARFVDEKISLCQNCDWSSHRASSSGESHGRLTISSYNGCPSAAVLTSMWSFVLDSNAHLVENSCSSTCELELGQSFVDDDIIMDEVDLSFENYEEPFGINFNQSEDPFENFGIDSALSHPVLPEYSAVVSTDSIRTSNTEPILKFSTKRADSRISFSGTTYNTCGEYRDCGASTGTGTSNPSSERTSAVMRYMEKKKTRK